MFEGDGIFYNRNNYAQPLHIYICYNPLTFTCSRYCIKYHMVDFFVRHRLLNSPQQGFLKVRSCLTNMLCLFEEITKWIDEGSSINIALDFQKAFDKVPHKKYYLC